VKLYTFFRSSAAFRVRIALNLKGLAYEPRRVSLPKGDHRRPEYARVNRQALVPMIELDDGTRLIQSLAIIEFLDEKYPQPPLVPKDALGRARVRSLALLIACEIHPLNNLRALNYLRKDLGLLEEQVNAWYRHWIAEGFRMLESFLLENKKHGKYCFRDQVTMADCCLVPQVFNAKLYKCDLKPYPTVMRLHEECMKLEAFIAAQPSKQPDAA